MSRDRLAATIAMIVAAGALGFSVGRASEPAPASATPAAQESVSTQTIYRTLQQINRNVGKYGPAATELYKICLELRAQSFDPGC
jgi:hypothetical protein